MKILVTGAAGFIGFHVTKRLIEDGYKVIGLDNLNNYYDVKLKLARLDELKKLNLEGKDSFEFMQLNLEDQYNLESLFKINKPTHVINLAAQAGVRYSVENPSAYINSNLVGFSNILECCRNYQIKHLVYASSSSVYGINTNTPFSEDNNVDHPVSLYAATKKSNELLAHSYSYLYKVPTTGLRFFTVYGPWGRPDMAMFLFTKAIISGKPIQVFNNGNMIRDFSYIDDIVESLIRIIFKPATPDNNFNSLKPIPSISSAPYRLFNIGNSQPTSLMKYIEAIEQKLGIIAKKEFLPLQPGDVQRTSADTKLLKEWVDFKPNTSIFNGISKFIDWYKEFYK